MVERAPGWSQPAKLACGHRSHLLVGTNPAAWPATPAPAPTTSAAPTAMPTSDPAAQGLYAVGGLTGKGLNPIAKTTALATDAAAPAGQTARRPLRAAPAATRLRRRLRQHCFEFLADDGRLTMPNTPEMADVAGNRGLMR